MIIFFEEVLKNGGLLGLIAIMGMTAVILALLILLKQKNM